VRDRWEDAGQERWALSPMSLAQTCRLESFLSSVFSIVTPSSGPFLLALLRSRQSKCCLLLIVWHVDIVVDLPVFLNGDISHSLLQLLIPSDDVPSLPNHPALVQCPTTRAHLRFSRPRPKDHFQPNILFRRPKAVFRVDYAKVDFLSRLVRHQVALVHRTAHPRQICDGYALRIEGNDRRGPSKTDLP